MQHRSAHHHRLVSGRDVSDGDGLDAVGQVGKYTIVLAHGRLLTGTHHQRHVGAVDIGVDEAHACPKLAERDSQVDGDGGLAYTAFAGTNSDDLRYARQSDGRRQVRRMRHSNWLLLV